MSAIWSAILVADSGSTGIIEKALDYTIYLAMRTRNSNKNSGLTPWKPGQSGNPSGRPKGTRDLANVVMDASSDGEELVDLLLGIVRGGVPDLPGVTKHPVVRVADRLKAVEILLDRGWGKAPQQLDVSSGDSGLVWSEVFKTWSTDDLRAALLLLEGNVVEGKAEAVD